MKSLRFILIVTGIPLIFFSASAQIINEEVFPKLPYKTNSSSIAAASAGFFIPGVSSLDWSFPLSDYWGTTSLTYCILSPTSLAKKIILLPDVEESRSYGLGGGANVIDNSFVMTSADSLFALWSNMRQTYTDVPPNIYYDSLPTLSLAKYNGDSFQKILTLQNGLHPAITSDKSNTLHFVWEKISPIDSIYSFDFSKYSSTLYYQSRNSNGEYSTPVEIGRGFYPEIKVKNDSVYIIFLEADSSNQQIGYLSYIAGSANHLGTAVHLQIIILNPYAGSWYPLLKRSTQWNVDSSGAIHIVWHYNYSSVSQESYIIHYSKGSGLYIDSLNDTHAQTIFLKNGNVGIFSIVSRNDSSFLQYHISKAGSPLKKLAEHYLGIFNLTLSQILVDSAGNQHVLLTSTPTTSYLMKYSTTDSAKLAPLSSMYTIFPSSYVDGTNRIWLTGKRDSTNVLLNFSLDDVGKTEDFDFPLHVGDLWQYYVTNIENPDPLSSFVGYDNVRAEKDTVMPNGKSYVLLKSDAGYILKSSYVRKDGFRVYLYSSNDSTDHVLYDFSKSIGDTIGDHERVQDILTDNVFGKMKTIFKMFGAIAPFSSIADSIGIIEMATGLSYDMLLSEAIINDKTYGTVVAVKENPHPVPNVFSLSQNFPNPFNPATHFRFSIADFGFVSLKVFDVLGREIATLVNERKSPGTYEVEWNAGNVSSGVYFYRLQSGKYIETKKLMVLK